MPLQIHIVGREQSLEDAIEKGVKAIQAKALGLAVAYVSIFLWREIYTPIKVQHQYFARQTYR